MWRVPRGELVEHALQRHAADQLHRVEGLAVLIEVRDVAHSSGVQLRLVCTARRVIRPLAIAGLVSLFDIHPTVDEALAPT